MCRALQVSAGLDELPELRAICERCGSTAALAAVHSVVGVGELRGSGSAAYHSQLAAAATVLAVVGELHEQRETTRLAASALNQLVAFVYLAGRGASGAGGADHSSGTAGSEAEAAPTTAATCSPAVAGNAPAQSSSRRSPRQLQEQEQEQGHWGQEDEKQGQQEQLQQQEQAQEQQAQEQQAQQLQQQPAAAASLETPVRQPRVRPQSPATIAAESPEANAYREYTRTPPKAWTPVPGSTSPEPRRASRPRRGSPANRRCVPSSTSLHTEIVGADPMHRTGGARWALAPAAL